MWNTTQHYRREFTKLTAGAGAGAGGVAGMGATHLEHRLLLDCIRRRDADDAERVLVMHIRRTRLALERHPEIFG
jgi:DNA-binding GntR family transcriptional regulator